MKKATLVVEKGVLEIQLDMEENKISFVKITGDFFIYPEEALEELEKVFLYSTLNKEELLIKVRDTYKNLSISSPGVKAEDWIEVLFKAASISD